MPLVQLFSLFCFLSPTWCGRTTQHWIYLRSEKHSQLRTLFNITKVASLQQPTIQCSTLDHWVSYDTVCALDLQGNLKNNRLAASSTWRARHPSGICARSALKFTIVLWLPLPLSIKVSQRERRPNREFLH